MHLNHCWIILFLFFFSLNTIQSKSETKNEIPSLSEESIISLLTCAPGDELYSVFGHTAIRVNDPDQEIDMVFNYGTFDFNTSFFYLKFAHGSLDYLLSTSEFKSFMREYFVAGRSVWEQELDLGEEQKDRLFRALMINARPENRAYRYDFFFDNCATRVRDVLLDSFEKENLSFGKGGVAEELTFRQAIHPYLEAKPWTKIGIDLVLGIPADEMTDVRSVMFLPDHLMEQFSGISIQQGAEKRQLIKGEKQLLDFPSPVESGLSAISPMLILWIAALLIIMLSLAEIFGYIRMKRVDVVLFSINGIIGLIIAYLWMISLHEATGPNLNILWAHPLWFFFVFGNRYRWWGKVLRYVQLTLLIVLIFTFSLLPQSIPFEFVPVWIILAVRLGKPYIGDILINEKK